jgi:hypothetical protein
MAALAIGPIRAQKLPARACRRRVSVSLNCGECEVVHTGQCEADHILPRVIMRNSPVRIIPGMAINKSMEICELCRSGKITKARQDITFHQWTDKGNLSCTVTIPIGICDNCGARIWDEETEAAIEQAVKREYDKRP